MGDRLRATNHYLKSAGLPLRLGSLPTWILISLTANILLLALALLMLQRSTTPVSAPRTALATPVNVAPASTTATSTETIPELGPRHQLTYEQWIDLLEQEANVAAAQDPSRLTVLVGDSLSLWFPYHLLPSERNWLNQGISGETSSGLLERLVLFDQTQPEAIFIMIGINDLLRGISDEAILDNQYQIIRYLKDTHPRSQIIVQSILPHASEKATWEGRERLLQLPNSRIRALNQSLEAIAAEEDVYYLDLYPLFADVDGNLQTALSTDGLHLNPQGYQVWRIAIQIFSQVQLEPQLAEAQQ